MAEEVTAISSGYGAGPGLVGIANRPGWMGAKIYGFMEMTMRPVNPSPRFDLIKARFPLCSLYWSVILARLGSPTILVRRPQKRNSGLQVPGSLLGQGGAGSGAGQVGCLLTTDKLRCSIGKIVVSKFMSKLFSNC